MGRIEMHADGFGVKIPGFACPLLTFAFVGRQLQNASVSQMIRLVSIEHGLHQILAGRDSG
jgi:hypothetical protein